MLSFGGSFEESTALATGLSSVTGVAVGDTSRDANEPFLDKPTQVGLSMIQLVCLFICLFDFFFLASLR